MTRSASRKSRNLNRVLPKGNYLCIQVLDIKSLSILLHAFIITHFLRLLFGFHFVFNSKMVLIDNFLVVKSNYKLLVIIECYNMRWRKILLDVSSNCSYAWRHPCVGTQIFQENQIIS